MEASELGGAVTEPLLLTGETASMLDSVWVHLAASISTVSQLRSDRPAALKAVAGRPASLAHESTALSPPSGDPREAALRSPKRTRGALGPDRPGTNPDQHTPLTSEPVTGSH